MNRDKIFNLQKDILVTLDKYPELSFTDIQAAMTGALQIAQTEYTTKEEVKMQEEMKKRKEEDTKKWNQRQEELKKEADKK